MCTDVCIMRISIQAVMYCSQTASQCVLITQAPWHLDKTQLCCHIMYHIRWYEWICDLEGISFLMGSIHRLCLRVSGFLLCRFANDKIARPCPHLCVCDLSRTSSAPSRVCNEPVFSSLGCILISSSLLAYRILLTHTTLSLTCFVLAWTVCSCWGASSCLGASNHPII